MDRKTFVKRAIGLGIGTSVVGQSMTALHAYSAHSSLKNPELVKKFKAVSNGLVCTCGKNLPISQINDIGHCNTWPMRSVIDGLLESGYSEDFILNGFNKGFGDMVATHQAFKMVREQEYGYLQSGMQGGFGEKILSVPNNSSPLLASVISFGALVLGGLLAFIAKKKAPVKAVNATLSAAEEERIAKSMNQQND